MFKTFNSRILVIDDEETIRDSFREILCPVRSARPGLEELATATAELFGSSNVKPSTPEILKFNMDEAATGKVGYEMVKKACADNNPYAAIFVDMRMPGWDGLETVIQIRAIDNRSEIIFVTAYSDHSIQDIVAKAGANVCYYCKPFSVEEILQIATKSVYEWNKASNLEGLIAVISQIRAQHWQLDKLLCNILSQVSEILGCNSGLLAVKSPSKYDIITASGVLKDPEVAKKYLDSIPVKLEGQIYESEDMLYFALEEYGIVTLFDRRNVTLHSERIYLVRLFLEQAAAALKNMDLQEALVRQEKLSAVGQAMSMLSHDLRNSIGGVISLCELAEQDMNDKNSLLEDLNMISTAAQNALEMVTDVLDFTRNREVEKTTLHSEELLGTIKKAAKGLLEDHKVSLEIDAPPDFSFSGDSSKMFRVLLNLIRNAAEAMRDAKTVNPKINVSLSQNSHQVVIKVKDNGPGIPEPIRGSLFMAFTTCGKAEGTGLGLAIAKQFVEAHGGSIGVETSNSGTEFTIILPVN
ncbi:MAG: hybrid sensor histidine kinase/response regulator [Victivallaceae bacterium]